MISEKYFRLKKNGGPTSICYCRRPELIENYAEAMADTTQIWECHHRLESCFTQKFLKEMNLYYDVEPEALIFLTQAEHSKIDSFCKRIGEANSKKVLCVETGKVFESIMEAQRQTGIDFRHISRVCRGKRKTSGGFHWSYV